MPVASGTLIAESLRCGAKLDGLLLAVDKISRLDAGDVDSGQPLTWTFIEFSVDVDRLDRWVSLLTGALDDQVGWYCDFRSADETFVAFAGRVFRYPRGDGVGRSLAADYARSIGVPDAQIDWPE